MSISKIKPLISPQKYSQRITKSVLFAVVLIIFSLGIGMVGYHYTCSLSWIDSLLNASMILTGMGPVSVITNNAGKVFASAYALFSGIAFLSIFAVFFAPIFHNFLHRFHLDVREDDDKK